MNVYDHSPTQRGWPGRAAQSEDLMIMAQRILGVKQARALFQAEVQNQGGQGYLPDPHQNFYGRWNVNWRGPLVRPPHMR